MDLLKNILRVGCSSLVFAFLVSGLFYTEWYYYSTSDALRWAESHVVSVSADTADSDLEAELVHLAGDIRADSTRADPVFEVETSSVKLKRFVEEFEGLSRYGGWH